MTPRRPVPGVYNAMQGQPAPHRPFPWLRVTVAFGIIVSGVALLVVFG